MPPPRWWRRSEGEAPSPPPWATVSCSFCGKTEHEVRKIVAGPNVWICDECIGLCNDVIEQECEREAAADPARTETLTQSVACALCRLPEDASELILVADDRFVCRPCAEAVRAALDPSDD
jgi:hypothetical protein